MPTTMYGLGHGFHDSAGNATNSPPTATVPAAPGRYQPGPFAPSGETHRHLTGIAALVAPLADELSAGVENNTPDDWVGAGGAERAGRERNRSSHREGCIGCGHRVLLPLRARTPGAR
jgi:hypothetical protein